MQCGLLEKKPQGISKLLCVERDTVANNILHALALTACAHFAKAIPDLLSDDLTVPCRKGKEDWKLM